MMKMVIFAIKNGSAEDLRDRPEMNKKEKRGKKKEQAQKLKNE